MENINCQNCKQDFTIEPDDFSFYEKIKVPPPTFCPDCRAKRRYIWRNERMLYKRDCDLCKKSCIFIYDKDVPFPVYCRECYLSDKWDPATYSLVYDKHISFLAQIKSLLDVVPRLGIWTVACQNSEYTNLSYNNRNAYLSFGFRDCDDVAYLAHAIADRQTYDSAYTHHSEQCYENLNVEKSYNSVFLQECEGMVDSEYAFACRNCENVFGGINLRSVKNNFFGEQLSKEEYMKRISLLELDKRSVRNVVKEKFNDIKSHSIVKATQQTNCVNSVGDHLAHTKNCHMVFDGSNLDNARYSTWVFTSKDICDTFGMGGSELVYEAISPEEVRNCKFIIITDSSHDCEYTAFCQSSSNLLGCVGVRSGEYMILNRKYEKDEYIKLLKEIKNDMDTLPFIDKGGIEYKYGEFFPPEFCSYGYNETSAEEYYPLTEGEARAQGFKWKENLARAYNPTLTEATLPDSIKEVSDDIINEVIECAHKENCMHQCTSAFRITQAELSFYRVHNIPLPVLCPNCRYGVRMESRNPMKLWDRICANCNLNIKSSYSKERSEIVYCESCYQKEVL